MWRVAVIAPRHSFFILICHNTLSIAYMDYNCLFTWILFLNPQDESLFCKGLNLEVALLFQVPL